MPFAWKYVEWCLPESSFIRTKRQGCIKSPVATIYIPSIYPKDIVPYCHLGAFGTYINSSLMYLLPTFLHLSGMYRGVLGYRLHDFWFWSQVGLILPPSTLCIDYGFAQFLGTWLVFLTLHKDCLGFEEFLLMGQIKMRFQPAFWLASFNKAKEFLYFQDVDTRALKAMLMLPTLPKTVSLIHGHQCKTQLRFHFQLSGLRLMSLWNSRSWQLESQFPVCSH